MVRASRVTGGLGVVRVGVGRTVWEDVISMYPILNIHRQIARKYRHLRLDGLMGFAGQ